MAGGILEHRISVAESLREYSRFAVAWGRELAKDIVNLLL